jgi:Transport and Golgi organisation 2
MCTLTIAPTKDGFLAGMNRDELRSRPLALPPQVFRREGVQAIYPHEAGGGTWIACSTRGNLLALLNWSFADSKAMGLKLKTRGSLIPELIYENNSRAAGARLLGLDLAGMHAFRLVGAFGTEKTVCEWRWNGHHMEKADYAWELRHWFSSSLSDTAASEFRGRTCAAAASAAKSVSREWITALHRSHDPGPGLFSICVHRPDATTVSYTEVQCDRQVASMSYLSGSPCEKAAFDKTVSVPINLKTAASTGS